MVPVSLKLSNFTSYGIDVPTLDFKNFHLAAISGQNGAGKSSLLDSITWCLWGTSRLGDSTDPLVRLGSTEMFVEVSFELDGHLYTVKRKRVTKSGGSTALEFFSNSRSETGDATATHNLTEGTIKATQQKIIDTLHLTYETFVNSAFIRQGHADEFTTKGPSERKRILADILGLSGYDTLEEKAKEKAKEAQTKLQLLDYQILEIEAELSQKEEREKKLSEAESEAEKAEEELSVVEKLIREIERERDLISNKLQSLQEKQIKLQAAEKELFDLKIQISSKEKAKDEYQQILEQRTKIESDYADLQRLQEEKKVLDLKRSDLIRVKDELADIQKALIVRKEKRDKVVSDLEVQIKGLQTIIDQKIEENEQLSSRKDVCPTCNQPIGEEKNKEIIKGNDEIISQNQSQIKELEIKRDKFVSFIFPEEQQAAERDKQIKILEDETKEYFKISDTINSLSKSENLYLKLKEADTAVKAHQEAIIDLQKVYQSRESQVKEESEELKALDNLKTQLKEVEEKLQAREVIKKGLSLKSQTLRASVGEAKQLVSRTKQLEDTLQKRSGEKGKLKGDREAYDELALAFGKKGIQAMIIETAVPEIEEEANKLLEKLTEGRMKVRLETQKETKAGTTQETLDIVISDEMGERPYEAYSGGEQFRVNVAIRLALSKLLTHRAGSKLQFLVIDEGFGTQDAQGRSRIIEALSIIKDDFEKIVIITHLEELKEEFPVRIEVFKGPAGSTFEVVGA